MVSAEGEKHTHTHTHTDTQRERDREREKERERIKHLLAQLLPPPRTAASLHLRALLRPQLESACEYGWRQRRQLVTKRELDVFPADVGEVGDGLVHLSEQGV